MSSYRNVFRATTLFCVLIAGNAFFSAFGQDTLRVMHYNLLNYGNFTSSCTSTNNALADKDVHLTTICNYVKPDILTVNEMGDNNVYGNRILANVLNTGSKTSYEKGDFTNNGFSSIVNHIFYDSDKLTLARQEFVDKDLSNSNIVRVLDIYTLYYNDPNLATTLDTTFLHVVVVHLKAGSSNSDRVDRDASTEALMAHLDAKDLRGNYILCGDFNARSSTEDGMQNLLTHPNEQFRFLDPINQLGSWNNSSAFAQYHTQSTRTSGGCFSGGGMDDRFDLILANSHVINDSANISIVPGSYDALGQDGNRFNGTINSPSNASVPVGVANALFEMSDHLPVIVDLKFSGLVTGDAELDAQGTSVVFTNPVMDDWNLQIANFKGTVATLELFTLTGQRVFTEQVPANGDQRLIYRDAFPDLPAGTYVVRLYNENGWSWASPVVKI
ncbi:MAG: T9SS type A sorting domain-containing protein [Salibacteraceae bacterium]